MKFTKLTKMMKLKHLPLLIVAFGATTAAFAQWGASTAGNAVNVEVIDKLGTTVKSLLEGKGGLVIDGIILSAAAYGTAVTKSPAPIVCGIVSCAVFHIAIKLIL